MGSLSFLRDQDCFLMAEGLLMEQELSHGYLMAKLKEVEGGLSPLECL